MDLALNNLQKLIYQNTKTKQNKQTNQANLDLLASNYTWDVSVNSKADLANSAQELTQQ